MSADGVSLPPIPADIAFITGPTVLGVCFNWGFLGILMTQLYFYSDTYIKDSLHIKILVYGLSAVEVLQTCMITADAFHWFVYGFGDMNRLDDTFLNSWDVVLIGAVVALVVQGFYSWRIHRLQESYFLPLLILSISLTQCAGGIATAVGAYRLGHLSLIGTLVAEQTTWLVCSAAADILITISLCWTLLRARERVPSTSHGMIKRLIRATVETNAVTTITAVIALILFLAVPKHSSLVVPPTAILSKLYTNCLIAVLNNRRQTITGSLKESSREATTANRYTTQLTGRFGHGTRSGFSPEEPMKVSIVRNVDLKVDSDIELGKVQPQKGQWASQGTL